jgi:hypothetical protein
MGLCTVTLIPGVAEIADIKRAVDDLFECGRIFEDNAVEDGTAAVDHADEQALRIFRQALKSDHKRMMFVGEDWSVGLRPGGASQCPHPLSFSRCRR